MPAVVKRTSRRGRYSVSTPGGVKAKGTTLAKAKRQQRLLNALEHNPSFKKKLRRSKRR